MTTIKAVLFDYGMVLSGPPDPISRERLRKVFGVEASEFDTAYWKHRDAYDRGALRSDSYWTEVAKEFGFSLSDSHRQELTAADAAMWTQPNQPMIDWAILVQRAGIKTGILSNIGDVMEENVRARFAWMSDFDHHTFSHRVGIAKPDAAIYRHAAEGLEVAPAEILFLDDREENIDAARAAGMQAIQYVDHESFLAVMRAKGLDRLLDPFSKT